MGRIHNKASERSFQKFITRIDGKPIGVRRLFCVTPNCGQQGELLDRTTDGFPSNFIIKKFEQKGWSVGANEKHDYCPKCVEAERVERRRRQSTTKAVNLKIVSQEPDMSSVVPMIEAPPAMGRDDRRLIFAKLADVYVDEATGYQTPWTDAAVSKDLGVPVAWVVTLREENFGPAHDNQEIRDMLARVEAEAIVVNAVLAEAKAIRAEGAALVKRINAVNEQVADSGRKLDGLLTIADRIKKAVE